MTSGSRPFIQSLKSISAGLVILTANLGAQKVNVVVIDFDGYGISEPDAISLTSVLRMELLRLGSFRVVKRSVMQSILAKQNLQLSACTSDECLVNIGRLTGAQQAVGGSVSEVAGIYSISARIIDVRTGERLIAVEYDITGQLSDALTRGMPEIARLLTAMPPRAVTLPTADRRAPTRFAAPRRPDKSVPTRSMTPRQTDRSVPTPSEKTRQTKRPPPAGAGLMPKSFVGLDLNMFYAYKVKQVPGWGPRVSGVALLGMAFKQYLLPLAPGKFNVYLGYGTDYFILPYAAFGADFIHKNGKYYLGVSVSSRATTFFSPIPLVAAGLIL